MTLTLYEIQQIMILRGLGYRQVDIANKINVSTKTVQNYLQQLKYKSKSLMESGMMLDDVYFKLFYRGLQ